MLSAMKFRIILWGMAQLLWYVAWRHPAFRARLVSAGTAARSGSSADFAAAIEDQRAKIAAIHQANATSKP